MLAENIFVLQLGKDEEMDNGLGATIDKATRQGGPGLPADHQYVVENISALPGWSNADAVNKVSDRFQPFVTAAQAACALGTTVGLYIVSHGAQSGKLAKFEQAGASAGLARFIVSLGFTRLDKLNIQACSIGGTEQKGMDVADNSFLSVFAKELVRNNLRPMIACYKGLNYNSQYDGKHASVALSKGIKQTIWGDKPSKADQKEMQTASAKIKSLAAAKHMTLVKVDKNGYVPVAFLPDRSEFKKVVRWQNGVDDGHLSEVDLSAWSAKAVTNTRADLRAKLLPVT